MKTGRDARPGGSDMQGLFKFVFSAACLIVGFSAHAETVIAGTVNCRAAARTTSPVLGTLKHGMDVPVLSTAQGWSYVDPPALPACWVRRDLLGPRTVAYAGYVSDPAATVVRSRLSSHRRGSGFSNRARYSRSSARRSYATGIDTRGRGGGYSYGGGNCPCSGSNICVGPRGGRYCITSGGNKRYGL